MERSEAVSRRGRKKRWSRADRGAGGCRTGTEREAGVTEICWSAERLFRRSHSAHILWPNIVILDLSKAISRKRCNIEGKLVLITNRKSHRSL